MIVEADAPRRCTGGGDTAEAACEVGDAVKRRDRRRARERSAARKARGGVRDAHMESLCGDRRAHAPPPAPRTRHASREARERVSGVRSLGTRRAANYSVFGSRVPTQHVFETTHLSGLAPAAAAPAS